MLHRQIFAQNIVRYLKTPILAMCFVVVLIVGESGLPNSRLPSWQAPPPVGKSRYESSSLEVFCLDEIIMTGG